MRIHRIFTPQDLEAGAQVELEKQSSHYLARVVRAQAGQAVVLFNGDGYDYASEVVNPARPFSTIRVLTRLPAAPESGLDCTLVQAIARGERMDQVLQKSTELGVSAFQPLFSERVEVRLSGERLNRRILHWQGVVISACEQSGRAVVPKVHAPLALHEWLERSAASGEQRIVLHPGSERSLQSVELTDRIALLVGPEGGFSRKEVELMCIRGVLAARLGGRILRTETAGPAAVAILQSLKGDLGL